MSEGYIFDDGQAYENFMGVWSRLVGEQFLDWVSPAAGLRWADIGCGNGCSTEQLFARTTASAIEALDPSAEQLRHAQTLLAGKPVTFHHGSAMALPLADHSVDAAVMALVLFFVPEPAQGLAEMVRVTRPGGLVCAYLWDVPAGGLPWDAVWRAQAAIGLPVLKPPSAPVSALPVLADLWRSGALTDVDARHILVERRFSDFDSYWTAWLRGSPTRAAIPADRLQELRRAVRDTLGVAEGTAFTVTGTASAVKGRKPG